MPLRELPNLAHHARAAEFGLDSLVGSLRVCALVIRKPEKARPAHQSAGNCS